MIPTRRHTLLPVVLVLVGGAAAALGARAIGVDDKATEGELVGIEAPPTVVLRVGDALRRIPCADLRTLELRSGKPTPDREATTLVLRNGDRLRGRLGEGGGRAIRVSVALAGAAQCPLRAIERIELPCPQPPRPLQAGSRADRLLFRNGERVEGTVEAIGAGGITFRSPLLGQLEVAFDRLAAIAFAAHQARPPDPKQGIVAIVHGTDGTVVSGRPGRLADGQFKLDATFGAELRIRADRILFIEFRGGRLVYLSDIEPAELKETPFFDLVWHHRRDRSVDGNPLRLGDRTYRKGLGVHSRCEITYDLARGYRRFLAHVGIDEEVGEKGDADVAVLVDGQVRFEKKGLTGADDAVAVALDVAGASRLTLRVDFGKGFDICDHVDWANARLIR